MAEEVLDANAAQRRYWNAVARPRWVAAPGLRERAIRKALRYCWRVWALPVARTCSKSAVAPAH